MSQAYDNNSPKRKEKEKRRPRVTRPSPRAFFLLWLPSIFAAVAVLLPIVYLLIRAFSGGLSPWAFLLRSQTLTVLARTLWLGAWVTLASIIIALPIAWLTVRTDLPQRRLWAILTPLPLVIPSYVGAYLFASALGPRGLLQGLLEEPFGITRLPDIYGFPGALLVLTLLNYPFVLLSLRAALHRMDPALEEASRSLGENNWRTFWRVIFPQLRPAMASGGLLVLLYVLRDFGAVSIMRYDTFTRVIYIQYQNSFDRITAAALAIVLVALSISVLIAEYRARGRAKLERNPRATRLPKLIELGRWRWPALLLCATVVTWALLLPAGILSFWLLRGLADGGAIANLLPALKNSVFAAGLAAGIAVLAAIPVVILDVRRPSWISRVIERSTYMGFALPGIVIALALVFFGANLTPFLYQTLPMLLFAYMILFLPETVGSLRASLLQVHPSLEEAASSLGKKPAEVFRRITFPLIRPGLAGGAALVFLTSMKELPATLILAPTGFKTLSTSIWAAVSEAFFAQAAAPALLLIIASSVPLAILLHRERRER